MNFNFADFFIWYLVFVFSTTCHEAAHAYLAYRGGDLTAYAGGHVTLDPIPHIRRSPWGMVLIPIISYFYYGWMIGWASVPYNPLWARRHPRRAAFMSLAGPGANFLLAAVALVGLKIMLSTGVLSNASGSSPLIAVGHALWIMLRLNVMLGIFNLIPLPPLDGASVVEGLSPTEAGRFYSWLRSVPAFEMLGMLVAWRVFPYVGDPAQAFVISLLH